MSAKLAQSRGGPPCSAPAQQEKPGTAGEWVDAACGIQERGRGPRKACSAQGDCRVFRPVLVGLGSPRDRPEVAQRSPRDRPEIAQRSPRDRPEVAQRSPRDRPEIATAGQRHRDGTPLWLWSTAATVPRSLSTWIDDCGRAEINLAADSVCLTSRPPSQRQGGRKKQRTRRPPERGRPPRGSTWESRAATAARRRRRRPG